MQPTPYLNPPLVIGTFLTSVCALIFARAMAETGWAAQPLLLVGLATGFLLMMYGAFYHDDHPQRRGLSNRWENVA
jgi:hypothetical protein